MFDLASIGTSRAEEGVEMPVVHPRDRQPIMLENGVAMTVTLLGRSSEVFQETLRTIQKTRARIRGRGEQITDEHLFKEDTDTLVNCTRAWNIEGLDDKPFPYNPVNCRKLWNDLRFRWLRERALGFILEDGNFLPQASLNLADTPAISSDSTNHFPLAAQ